MATIKAGWLYADTLLQKMSRETSQRNDVLVKSESVCLLLEGEGGNGIIMDKR